MKHHLLSDVLLEGPSTPFDTPLTDVTVHLIVNSRFENVRDDRFTPCSPATLRPRHPKHRVFQIRWASERPHLFKHSVWGSVYLCTLEMPGMTGFETCQDANRCHKCFWTIWGCFFEPFLGNSCKYIKYVNIFSSTISHPNPPPSGIWASARVKAAAFLKKQHGVA